MNSSCSTWGQIISFWIAPHLSLSNAPSLALLLPYLISGPDLGVWPDCWGSVEIGWNSSAYPSLRRGG